MDAGPCPFSVLAFALPLNFAPSVFHHALCFPLRSLRSSAVAVCCSTLSFHTLILPPSLPFASQTLHNELRPFILSWLVAKLCPSSLHVCPLLLYPFILVLGSLHPRTPPPSRPAACDGRTLSSPFPLGQSAPCFTYAARSCPLLCPLLPSLSPF